jgi:sugar lactone lactonase YvrE
LETLEPQLLVDGLGYPEAPRWRNGRLLVTDMIARTVLAIDPSGRADVVFALSEESGGLGFLPDGRLLVATVGDRRVLRLDADGLHLHADISALEPAGLNDMVVDAGGRAYVTGFGFDVFRNHPYQTAGIYLVTPEGEAREVATGLLFPNGVAITPDGSTLLVAETIRGSIAAFTIEADGSLSGWRNFLNLGENRPDGICLDADGAVWVSSLISGVFQRVLPGGEVTHEIRVGERWAVACMLGGEDRRTLYLCSAETNYQDRLRGVSRGRIETVQVAVPGAGWP